MRQRLVVVVLLDVVDGARLDVDHPADIILTYGSSNPYGYEREALSGIVQALLITKHMLFVGFSLTDDAFNQVLIDRSRNNVRRLGFFEEVEVNETPGSAPDRARVQVAVTEQPTGELAFGAGFSSTDAFLVDLSISERNLRGRGQFLRFRISASSNRESIDIRFTEPRFLDRNLAAGFDLFRVNSDFLSEASFQTESTGASVRLGFPVTASTNLQLGYTLRTDNVLVYSSASQALLNHLTHGTPMSKGRSENALCLHRIE